MSSLPWVAVLLVLTAPSAAGAQTYCSRETLPVRGTPVTIAYCITGQSPQAAGGQVGLTVEGNYSSGSGTFSRKSTMHFVKGEGPSRVLEDIQLEQLGVQGTLHVTLVYSGGLVHIESALLTPGAITIK